MLLAEEAEEQKLNQNRLHQIVDKEEDRSNPVLEVICSNEMRISVVLVLKRTVKAEMWKEDFR